MVAHHAKSRAVADKTTACLIACMMVSIPANKIIVYQAIEIFLNTIGLALVDLVPDK